MTSSSQKNDQFIAEKRPVHRRKMTSSSQKSDQFIAEK